MGRNVCVLRLIVLDVCWHFWLCGFSSFQLPYRNVRSGSWLAFVHDIPTLLFQPIIIWHNHCAVWKHLRVFYVRGTTRLCPESLHTASEDNV
jgi:hypothetical protein